MGVEHVDLPGDSRCSGYINLASAYFAIVGPDIQAGSIADQDFVVDSPLVVSEIPRMYDFGGSKFFAGDKLVDSVNCKNSWLRNLSEQMDDFAGSKFFAGGNLFDSVNCKNRWVHNLP